MPHLSFDSMLEQQNKVTMTKYLKLHPTILRINWAQISPLFVYELLLRSAPPRGKRGEEKRSEKVRELPAQPIRLQPLVPGARRALPPAAGPPCGGDVVLIKAPPVLL